MVSGFHKLLMPLGFLCLLSVDKFSPHNILDIQLSRDDQCAKNVVFQLFLFTGSFSTLVILQLCSWKTARFRSILLRQIGAIIQISSKRCIEKHCKNTHPTSKVFPLKFSARFRYNELQFHLLFENSFKLDSPERFVQLKNNFHIDKAITGEILARH